MILHCTQKLAARLPNMSTTPLAETSPLGGWHGNLYQIDRRQCVLFCHDETRYMLFLPGLKKAHFENLGRLHRDLFLLSLAAHGVPDAKIMRAGLALGPAVFDRATPAPRPDPRPKLSCFFFPAVLKVSPVVCGKNIGM
jgi:hypothetical protein